MLPFALDYEYVAKAQDQDTVLLQSLAANQLNMIAIQWAIILSTIYHPAQTNPSKSASRMHYWTTLSDYIIWLSIMLGQHVFVINRDALSPSKATSSCCQYHTSMWRMSRFQIARSRTWSPTTKRRILLLGRQLQWTSLDLGQSNWMDRITNLWLLRPSIPWQTIQILFASAIRRLSTSRNNLKIRGFTMSSPSAMHLLYDQGAEFIGHEVQSMLNDYNIIHRPTTVKNPQSNAFDENQYQRAERALKPVCLLTRWLSRCDPSREQNI